MKKGGLILIAAIIGVVSLTYLADQPSIDVIAQLQDSIKPLRDFTGGLFNRFSPHLIPDNTASDCENVIFDGDFGIQKRLGVTAYNSSELGGGADHVRHIDEYSQTDGTYFFMAVSSGTIYYSQDDGSFTALISTLTTSVKDMDSVVANNDWYFSNGTDMRYKFDGTSLIRTTDVPKGTILEWFINKLWVAGITLEPSTIWHSEQGDPDEFPPTHFDYIGLDDGDSITGMRRTPWNSLLITKERSTWEATGSYHDDIAFRLVDPTIGCLFDDSIQVRYGLMIWLSHDGLVEYNGSTIKLISEKIENTIADMSQTLGTSALWSQTSASDWGAGTTVSVDTTTTAGDLLCLETDQSQTAVAPTGLTLYDFQYSQSFTPEYTTKCDRIDILLFVNGVGQDHTVWVRETTNSGTIISTATITGADVVDGGWYSLDFSPTFQMSQGSVYFLYINKAGSSANGLRWRFNLPSYSRGSMYRDGVIKSFDTAFKQYTIDKSTHISQSHKVSADITTFGNFDVSEMGTIGITSYAISGSSHNGGFNTWTALTKNAPITLGSTSYIKIRTIFNKDSSTQTASVQSYTINWNEDRTFPPSSAIHDRRYYLSYREGDSASNDQTLIYDKYNGFTEYSYGYYSMTKYRKLLYGGRSNEGYIDRLEVPEQFTDNGTRIDSFWVSKDFDMGSRLHDKLFYRFYTLADYDINGYDLLVKYAVDRSTSYTTDEFQLDETLMYIQHETQLPNPSIYKYIRYRIDSDTNTTINKFHVDGIDMIYKMQELGVR